MSWRRPIPADTQAQIKAIQADLDPQLRHLSGERLSQFHYALACSDYFKQQAKIAPTNIIDLQDKLNRPVEIQDYHASANAMVNAQSIESLMQIIRMVRQQVFTHCWWRDLLGLADLTEVFKTLTTFADFIIEHSLQWIHHRVFQQAGLVFDESSPRLIVLALGKYGGEELNYSSDIDLIFAYENGHLGQDAANIFTKIAQTFIHVMQTPTAQGFVFRVDMRLRPYGDSGPLCSSLVELNHYYTGHAREWERYALIKLRPVTGEPRARHMLMQCVYPFIYHRFVDYSTIESLRAMKQLINRERSDSKFYHDIKRGPGGIREIEFIAQCFQLIHGGQDSGLQQRPCLAVLRHLKNRGHLPSQDCDDLISAYQFYRNLEHRLQMFNDQQTHRLPTEHQEAIALAMGLEWEDCLQALEQHRQRVEKHFHQLLHQQVDEQTYHPQLMQWPTLTADQKQRLLVDLGFDSVAVMACIEKLNMDRCSQKTRQLYERLIPVFIANLQTSSDVVALLEQVLDLFRACQKRNVYLILLAENIQIIPRLLTLFSKSPYFSKTIIRYPFLLDELVSTRPLRSAKTTQELDDECRQMMLAIPETDVSEQLECLRSFKCRQFLRVAIAEVERDMPLLSLSQHLTHTAEVIIAQVTACAMKQMPRELNLSIIAYGKLGSEEMSYQSDLDLVFVHDGEEQALVISLVQRMLHMFTAQLQNGILYQVDTRLRPSGQAGLLVLSYDAYEEYQHQKAWTFEHQALVRARMIRATDDICTRFDSMRTSILTQVRDPGALKQDISQMRQKMREIGHQNPQEKSILTDIEFIVQYCVLQYAYRIPALCGYTDNCNLLKVIKQARILPEADCDTLIQAYQAYRYVLCQRHLDIDEVIDESELAVYQKVITATWAHLFGA